MRRRTFGDYWFLFVLFIIFSGSGLLPLAIIFGAFFAVMYAAVKAANRTTVSNTNAYRRKTNSYGYTQRKTGNAHTAADLAKINVYLRKYFRTNTQLEMPNGIELFLRTDSYSNLNNLDVYRNGTRIGTLNEFRNRYKDLYDSLFETLLAMSKSAQKAGDVEIVDAEIEEATQTKKKKTTQKETANTTEKASTKAKQFMEGINSLNNDIPDEEISNGLFETSALLKQIDMLETKFPESSKKMQKMYDYYLPYLTRILQQYTNLQTVKSDANYERNVEQLKGTIKSINEALNTIIPSMSDSDFTNLSADMATLEALLRKDGLTGGIEMTEAVKKDGE
ncbi:MAG: hypothetical protein IKE51_00440 [Solobacterium sp.]|nr:hypothetical protein [Solobacterium sp.]